jgi:7-cyano-7-deazaguanine synthase
LTANKCIDYLEVVLYQGYFMRQSLLLLSGGIESTTLAYLLTQEGVALQGLFMKTGVGAPAHAFAYSTAKKLGIPVREVDVSGTVSLTRELFSEEIVLFDELDTGGDECNLSVLPSGRAVPTAFPVLLANATYYAQAMDISDIYVGVEGNQADSRPGLATTYAMWGQAMSVFDGDASIVRVVTPFIEMPKSEVVKLARTLGVPFEETWSCFLDGEVHCGTCPACQSRKKAFKLAQIVDPTVYAAEAASTTPVHLKA